MKLRDLVKRLDNPVTAGSADTEASNSTDTNKEHSQP